MLDIFKPKHNLKEICKESVLLETHLQIPGQRCPDCIMKHLLTMEALADEAIKIDVDGKMLHLTKALPEKIRAVQHAFHKGVNDHELGQHVRFIRKELAPLCFDANLEYDRMLKNQTRLGIKEAKKIKFSMPKNIAQTVWPMNDQHTPSFRHFLWALSKVSKTHTFSFSVPGVSARKRKKPEWIAQHAASKLKKGQINRMINQTLHNQISYDPLDWYNGVLSDLFGQEPVVLQTPSSSIGEYLDNLSRKVTAIKKAMVIDSVTLYSARENERVSAWDKAGTQFFSLGQKTKDPYFFLRSAVCFKKAHNQEAEIIALKKVLAIDPKNELAFWISNKIELLKKGGLNTFKTETNPFLIAGIAFVTGVVLTRL